MDYYIQSQGHREGKNVSVCPDDIFLTAKHFATKLGMVMQQRELECRAKRLVCNFQGQGHSNGLCDENITSFFFTISSEVLIPLQPNSIG